MPVAQGNPVPSQGASPRGPALVHVAVCGPVTGLPCGFKQIHAECLPDHGLGRVLYRQLNGRALLPWATSLRSPGVPLISSSSSSWRERRRSDPTGRTSVRGPSFRPACFLSRAPSCLWPQTPQTATRSWEAASLDMKSTEWLMGVQGNPPLQPLVPGGGTGDTPSYSCREAGRVRG